MKTAELNGAALDWAVAKCEGELDQADHYLHESTGAFMLEQGEVSVLYSPSTTWNQGGPIIEREIFKLFRNVGGTLTAQAKYRTEDGTVSGQVSWYSGSGPTLLIAAMRCYVASKLGDEVELPEDLK